MSKSDIENISKQELQTIVESCYNKTDLTKKLKLSLNGHSGNLINLLLEKYQISIDHFDSWKKLRERKKLTLIKKICPICNSEFETFDGSKREKITCSRSCSNSFFVNRHTKESRLKTSRTLLQKNNFNLNSMLINDQVLVELMCLSCSNIFYSKSRPRCCSKSCTKELRSKNKETGKKISLAIRQRIVAGTHKGWATRSKLTPSYPEQYVIKLFDELTLTSSYVHEYKCGSWFIDFANLKKKIALEIDGKQHELPERKFSDEKKDIFLAENGWKVVRFKWRRISKEVREELVKILLTNFG